MIHKDDFDGYLVFKNSSKFNKKTGRDIHQKKRVGLYKKYEKIIKNKKNQKLRDLNKISPSKANCCKKSKRFIFEKNGFKFYKCFKCEFIFVNPILKDEIFHSNLVDEDSYTNVMKNRINLNLDKKKFKYGLNKIKIKKKNKSLLDIGCGFGFFIDEAKKLDWQCMGSEFSKDCLKVLREKKIEIFDFKNSKHYEKFDLITMWTVLEHIANPNTIIKKAHKLLKKNGKILINVPNSGSLSARILRENCSMFSGEQHLNYYTPKTIEDLLKKYNFEIQSNETIISDIGTVKNFLNYENPYLGNSKFNSYILNSKKIHKELMGYTLLSIGKKL